MTSKGTTFQIGDKVVYAMHGTGQVKGILPRTLGDAVQHFYRVALDKNRGEVLLSVDQASTLGLRHAMQASEVAKVMRQLQQPAARPVKRGQVEGDYTWCKQQLRRGDVLGLAEVRRFLHDLEQTEGVSNLHLRQLRTYVYTQLPAEIAQALKYSLATAERLIDLALTSKKPVPLPPQPEAEAVH
jgi:CarD family transcriptional regulator